MSYSIIFETKVVKLSDGRILHLSLDGCNNDDSGRSRDEFRGILYKNEEAFEELAQSYLRKKSDYDGFDIKIGSNYVNINEYGSHLLRMLERAKTFSELTKNRTLRAIQFDGVEMLEPEEKTFTPDEFEEVFYKLVYSSERLRYKRLTTSLETEAEIIGALDNDKRLSFYVSRKLRGSN